MNSPLRGNTPEAPPQSRKKHTPSQQCPPGSQSPPRNPAQFRSGGLFFPPFFQYYLSPSDEAISLHPNYPLNTFNTTTTTSTTTTSSHLVRPCPVSGNETARTDTSVIMLARFGCRCCYLHDCLVRGCVPGISGGPTVQGLPDGNGFAVRRGNVSAELSAETFREMTAQYGAGLR